MSEEISDEVDRTAESVRSRIVRVQRFIADESGPTAVEYAIMLALIILVCVSTIGTIGSAASMGSFWDAVEALE